MALESSVLITNHLDEKGDDNSLLGRSVDNIKEVKDALVAGDKIGVVLQEASVELAPLGQRLIEWLSIGTQGGLL